MKLFSKKLIIKENGKIIYIKVPKKLFIAEKVSNVCQLTECKVFYVEVDDLGRKEAIQLNEELVAGNKADNIKQNGDLELIITAKAEQVKDVLYTIIKYNYDELCLWDTLDRTKISDSKFHLTYWKREYNFFELYFHPSIPNLEQIKQVFMHN